MGLARLAAAIVTSLVMTTLGRGGAELAEIPGSLNVHASGENKLAQPRLMPSVRLARWTTAIRAGAISEL